MSTVGEVSARAALQAKEPALTLADVYARHTDFIWKTLHRLGARAPHVEDVFQEVLLVVYRRLDSFDGSSALTTWLFGICLRVASDHRKRAQRRKELPLGDDGGAEAVAPDRSPEEEMQRREAEQRLASLLDRLSLEHRAVFVMFEIDGIPCDQIARMMGVPVGTVHSRLHWARRAFGRALGACRQREGGSR